jgi:aromatic ring hydroxylase-like protein
VSLPVGWADRVDVVEARCDAPAWAIPVLGEVPAAGALLIRPDGYVAWTNTDPAPFTEALTKWFGPTTLDRA